MRLTPVLLFALVSTSACAKRATATHDPDLDVRAVPTRSDAAPVAREAIDELLASFRRVHFDTDSAVLDAANLGVLQTSARLLIDHPTIVVEIEGHADERGTFDYNLALGSARADVVRKTLIGLGVTAARLRTTTLGEEKPAVDGHDEIAWAENRRAEFRVRVADGAQ